MLYDVGLVFKKGKNFERKRGEKRKCKKQNDSNWEEKTEEKIKMLKK